MGKINNMQLEYDAARTPHHKIDFKTKAIVKDKCDHYIKIKRSIQQDDITFVNIYTSDIGIPKCIKQILRDLKGEINSNTIIVGEYTLLILTDR